MRRLNPDDLGTYINRANAYMKLEQYERAIEDYDQSLKINPELPEESRSSSSSLLLSSCSAIFPSFLLGGLLELKSESTGEIG